MVRAEALRLRRGAGHLARLGADDRLRHPRHPARHRFRQAPGAVDRSRHPADDHLRRDQRPHHARGLALALGRGVMLSILMSAAAAAAAVQMTVPGPRGDIAGTFVDAGKNAPVVLIIPGSGPTDRDGNNPMGVTAAPYRLLAEALATRGVSTLRADKRGMFGSKSAIADANAVSIADYAADAHQWVDALRKRTGANCV